MIIKCIVKDSMKQFGLPQYATSASAGMDLRADTDHQERILMPLKRVLIQTGVFLALPPMYEAQIRSRSGLAHKHGIVVLNAPGTIDADYRGEIGVILINLSDELFVINHGDRIAQMVISQYTAVELQLTDSLSDTKRSHGGFGSTGVQ